MEGFTKKTAIISPASAKPKKKYGADSSPDATQSRPRIFQPPSLEPSYYIGGGNGNTIVEEAMNGMGWRRTKDKTDDSVRMRWCELKSSINYNSFREGEQMVNRIPNGSLLTNKLGLLNSLQEHCRICNTIQKRPINVDFLPETYRLDDTKDRETFTEVFKENEIWICKPTGRNQGKGIFLVRSLDELNNAVAEGDQINRQSQLQGKAQKPLNRIIQRYIMNPLLLEGRKFDIRCYMLFASTAPLLVLYHRGYIRLSMYEYDNSCKNIIAHLTNQFIQKKDPQYAAVKEQTAWSMDKFNEYINNKVAPQKGLEKDWVYGTLTKTMKQIMVQCVHAVKNKLQCRLGYFDMFGFDFFIDDDMKIWLIEVNVNPCLATNCEALRERVPGVIREALHLSIECFEKGRRGRPLLPLQSLKEFEMIYDGGGSGKAISPTRNSRGIMSERHASSSIHSPVRRARSLSPVKECTFSSTRKLPPQTAVSFAAVSKQPPPAATTYELSSSGIKNVGQALYSVSTDADCDEREITYDVPFRSSKPRTPHWFSEPESAELVLKTDTSVEKDNIEIEKPELTAEDSTSGRRLLYRNSGISKPGASHMKRSSYLIRPGVAKQSTSNTGAVKELQSHKKKLLIDNNYTRSGNTVDDEPSRGS